MAGCSCEAKAARKREALLLQSSLLEQAAGRFGPACSSGAAHGDRQTPAELAPRQLKPAKCTLSKIRKKKKTKNEKRSQKGKKNLCLSKDQAACKTNTMQQRTGSCLGGPILKKPTIAHPLSPPQDPWLLSLKETNNSWMQIDMEYNNVMDHLRTHGPHNILFSKLEGDGFHLVDEELLGWSHRASGGQWLKVHTNISDKWYSSGFCTGTCAVTYLH